MKTINEVEPDKLPERGTKVSVPTIPKLYIDHISLQRIRCYVDIAEGEISGMGEVAELPDGKGLVVTEIYLPAQKCGPASTEIEEEDIGKLALDIISAGKNPAALKFWWHSHVNMAVFWSGTDTSNITECLNISDVVRSKSSNYLLSTVFNKRGEMLTRFDYVTGFHRVTLDDLPLSTAWNIELYEACQAEVKAKVKSNSYVTSVYPKYRHWKGGALAHGQGSFSGTSQTGYYDSYDEFGENSAGLSTRAEEGLGLGLGVTLLPKGTVVDRLGNIITNPPKAPATKGSKKGKPAGPGTAKDLPSGMGEDVADFFNSLGKKDRLKFGIPLETVFTAGHGKSKSLPSAPAVESDTIGTPTESDQQAIIKAIEAETAILKSETSKVSPLDMDGDGWANYLELRMKDEEAKRKVMGLDIAPDPCTEMFTYVDPINATALIPFIPAVCKRLLSYSAAAKKGMDKILFNNIKHHSVCVCPFCVHTRELTYTQTFPTDKAVTTKSPTPLEGEDLAKAIRQLQ